MTLNLPTPPSGSDAGTAVQGPADASARESVTPLAMLTVVLRHLRLFLALPLLTAIFAVVLGMVTEPEFTASSTFSATDQRQDGQAAVLASRFGLNVGGGSQVNLPFYLEVLRSRELLRGVAGETYAIEFEPGTVRTGTLMELLELEGTERRRLRAAVGFLRDALTVTLKRDPGVMEVQVAAPHPDLAEALNANLLDHLTEFSLAVRRDAAAAERAFLQARLEEAAADLEAAEAALARFHEENRRFESSPELSNRLASLRRRVDMRQQVYLELTSGLDEARLNEARDLPIIRILDTPVGSARRSDLPAPVNAALGFVLGLVAALLAVLVMEYFRAARRELPEQYAELESQLLRMRQSVGRLRSRS